MRHYIVTILLLFLSTLAAFADGTKQLMPNKGTEASPEAQGFCYLALGSREGGKGTSRPFARYQHSSNPGASCPDEHRLYFRIANTGETVYLGFGGYRYDGEARSSTPTANAGLVQYRIKKSSTDNGYDGSDETDAVNDVIILAESSLPSSGNGLIESYAEAYYGPKTLSFNGTKGYDPITVTGLDAGLYYVEFDIGCDFDVAAGKAFDIEWFDITVATKKKNDPVTDSVINGRVYSKAWGLNANGKNNEVWATFYTYSTDYYTSKVYLAGVMPYRFVFGCNSYGSIDTASTEKNRQSYPNANSFVPEYLVFLTSPDTVSYGSAKVPNIPSGLTFSGDAITCEDLVFVIKLLYNESSTIELFLDGENGEKILVERLDAEKVKNRGYHYPWKDDKEIKTPGYHYYVPVTDDCTRRYKLSLFDQRFTVDTLINVGDKTLGTIDLTTPIDWSAALGSENNPILIRDETDLKELSSAISDKRDFTYTVNPFYVTPDGTLVPKPFSIPGGNNGFQGVHFYLTAPSNTLTLAGGWFGIGTIDNPFKGVFRCGKYNPDPANNNTNATETQNVGDQDTIVFNGAENPLFNYCDGATIDNIHVKGTIVTEEETSDIETGLGAICNYATNTTFSHCTNATSLLYDNVSAKTISVGGIVGIATNCTIDSCSNNISISPHADKVEIVGGIVGTLNGGNVNFCYNVGTITADSYAGGIIGNGTGNISITNSRNIGSVSAMSTGGIIGHSTATSLAISDCSNSGTISTGVYAGGIVGNGTAGGTISYCYNSGIIYGTTRSDALAHTTYTKTNSYGTIDGTPSTILPADVAPSTGHFYSDSNGQGIWATVCAGKTWRNEEAGRLFKNDSLFYITWDGKYDNGDCVTGELTVDYQKTSGITHFPFYDPENIDLGNKMKGMVVYRISPIQDSLKSKPEYTYLPKDYYQTSTLSSEQGIELSLYWDDRRIIKDDPCTNAAGGLYGNTISNKCHGIENVSKGGYLGSTGGHIFPQQNFGDKNTMNTWWNGVEVHGLSKLILYENTPAVLMPIELDKWGVTNLRMAVFLEWSTASETNNDFFTIERSANGTTWESIGRIDGAGTTSIKSEYSFEDAKPLDGISYYRIKQTDYNGAYSYTSIKCVNRPTNSDNVFIAYSNKLIDAFIIEGEQIAACPIELYTITGIKVSDISFNTISASKVVIATKNIPAGSYFIRICNTHKVVVKNW